MGNIQANANNNPQHINPLSGQEPIWAPGIDKGLSRNILRVNGLHILRLMAYIYLD